MRYTLPAALFMVTAVAACMDPFGPHRSGSDLAPADKNDTLSITALTPTVDSVAVGQTVFLKPTLVNQHGRLRLAENVAWVTSDSSVAQVVALGGGAAADSGVVGSVTGRAPGSVTITSTTRFNLSFSVTIQVVRSGTPIEINGGTAIEPGTDIQSAVNDAPSSSTFILKPGVHRLQSIVPKSGDMFVGEPGAILSGARLLTDFTREGPYWMVSGQTQRGQVGGDCSRARPGCAYPEDLFIDDVMLERVTSLAQVAPGKWYFDYGGHRIYFADDPTGHKVETSVKEHAFEGAARGVVIQGLVIEKFATPALDGAVRGDGDDWIILGNEIRWNHAGGLKLGSRSRALRNHVHHNGQEGIGSRGSVDALVDGNEIAYNNTAGFDIHFHAGGGKYSRTTRLTIRNNYVHHNNGVGIWTDIDNINSLCENNLVTDNASHGIFHEIGDRAVIRNNTVERNGLAAGGGGGFFGAGILVSSSPNVEIYDNVVSGNANGIAARQEARGSGAHGPHQVNNLYVHDNTISMTQGATGLAQFVGDNSYFTSRNNRFENNTYSLNGLGRPFEWFGMRLTAEQWREAGLDTSGTFRP